MEEWKSVLKSDPIEWLLEDNNPSVRYFALLEVLDKDPNDSEVKEAKGKIMTEGIVPKILSKQKAGGYWEAPQDFYIRTKYKGTVWSFIILAELGADGNDERIRKACEFILENSQDMSSGGFAYYSANKGGGDRNKIAPCLTGNMLWGLIRFGYLNDPRVQKGVEWITTYQRFDDGVEEAPTGWPYNIGSKKGEGCWGTHTCHMGVVKNLKALAEIPEEKRTKEVKGPIEQAAEYMLKHHIYKRSHDLNQVGKVEWTQAGFPLMWKIDFLEVLLILIKLGYKDERMQDAIDLLLSKQNENGRWILENTFNGRMQANIELKGKESKWITLNALKVLKKYSN